MKEPSDQRQFSGGNRLRCRLGAEEDASGVGNKENWRHFQGHPSELVVCYQELLFALVVRMVPDRGADTRI